MFIVSVKSDKIKKAVFLLFVATLAVIGGTLAVSTKETATVGNFRDISLKGSNHEERVAFFDSFGWKISDEPVEIKETVIPEEFDETYSEYNELQKKQSFNLEKYKGARVKSWSYEILNYPGYEDKKGHVRGNLLTYNGKIIGGDICSTELDGFIHGFDKNTVNVTEESSSLPQ